jgi:hypothetical protein
MTTALAAALKKRFPGADGKKNLLRRLGLSMDDLLNPGAPSGGGNADQLQKMRTALESVLSGVDDERLVASFLKVMDEFAPTDRVDASDPNAARARELAAGDDGQEAFRALLKKAGLSDETIDEALRIAAAGGNGEAVDRLPVHAAGKGGFGGYGHGVKVAADERRRAEFDLRFPNANAIAIGFDYGPARHRARPFSDAAIDDYNKRFPDAARIEA